MKKNINLLYYWDAEGYKSWQKIFSEKAPEIKVFNKSLIPKDGTTLVPFIDFNTTFSN